MKMWKAPTWQHFGTSTGGVFEIDGVNVWQHEWIRVVGKTAKVKDPAYGKPYTFSVYSIEQNGKTIEFAAGEFSNCVWGFCVFKL